MNKLTSTMSTKQLQVNVLRICLSKCTTKKYSLLHILKINVTVIPLFISFPFVCLCGRLNCKSYYICCHPHHFPQSEWVEKKQMRVCVWDCVCARVCSLRPFWRICTVQFPDRIVVKKKKNSNSIWGNQNYSGKHFTVSHNHLKHAFPYAKAKQVQKHICIKYCACFFSSISVALTKNLPPWSMSSFSTS